MVMVASAVLLPLLTFAVCLMLYLGFRAAAYGWHLGRASAKLRLRKKFDDNRDLLKELERDNG